MVIISGYLEFRNGGIILQLSNLSAGNSLKIHPQQGMKPLLLCILVFGGVSLTVLADFFLKKSAAHNASFLLVGIALYGLVAFPVALAFRITGFGQLFLIWEAATVVAGLIIATITFREALTWEKLAAFALVLIALVLSYRH